MTPFIPGQFGQCARHGRFITHFLPVCLSDRQEDGGRKEGTGGERESEGRGRGGTVWGAWELETRPKQRDGVEMTRLREIGEAESVW